MAASLSQTTKSVYKQSLQGMNQIQAKITELQYQYDQLLKRRSQEIAHLITSLDLATLDDKTLVGGLLYIKEKTAFHDPLKEVWRQAGERFLRRSKPRKQQPAQQAEASSSKHQSSQKPSQ